MSDVIQINHPIDDEVALLLMIDRLREQRARMEQDLQRPKAQADQKSPPHSARTSNQPSSN